MRKTAPFVVFRILVYFAISVAYVVVTGTGAGIGFAMGHAFDANSAPTFAFWGGGFGLAATVGVVYLLREYILYTVKAGHIAVMVELLQHNEIPQGQNQISFAKQKVTTHFATSTTLFGIDQIVKGVLGVVTGLLEGLLSLLPIPGLSALGNILRSYLKVAVGLLDEVILAQCFKTQTDNPWGTSREALVLYAQNAKPMLASAAWVTALVWALSFVVFLLMLAPAAALAYAIPGAWSAGGIAFAILFAWAVKAALIEPFAIACLLQAFFNVTDGQTPNPEWDARLSQASDKFRSMGARALNWAHPTPHAQTSKH